MNQSIYLLPNSIEEALRYLAEPIVHTVILAGGTDVVVELRENRKNPHPESSRNKRIIDISRIKELKSIEEKKGWIQLGALITHRELAESKLVQKYGYILAEAATQMGSPQVRNRGTLGGNLATASPAADTVPPLIALGATVMVQGLKYEKRNLIPTEAEIAIEDFFIAPGKTVLQSNELIVGVRFPKMKKNQFCRYYKLGQRNAVSISIVSIAIKAEIVNNRFGKVRIGLGSVAPRPIRARAAERILLNQPVNDKIITTAAEAASSECSTISDVRASGEYRCSMARELTKELLLSLKKGKTIDKH